MRLTALDLIGTGVPLAFQAISLPNQATEQPSTPNSKASPSTSSSSCLSLLSHIERLPTVPRRALIAHSPALQINHTRPSASHTHTASLSLWEKKGAINVYLTEHIHRAFSHSQNYASRAAECSECRTHTSSMCQKVGFSILFNFQFRKVLCISFAVSHFLVCSSSAL